MTKQIKCAHCQEWNDEKEKNCIQCGKMINEVYLKEKEILSRAKGMTLPLIEIREDDNFILKGVKSVFRVGQLIFFAIISTIAAMAASTVH